MVVVAVQGGCSLVPLALQVGRQRGVGGRGAQQIAPVVEVQQRQAGIRLPLPYAPDALVGRQVRDVVADARSSCCRSGAVLAHVSPKQVIPGGRRVQAPRRRAGACRCRDALVAAGACRRAKCIRGGRGLLTPRSHSVAADLPNADTPMSRQTPPGEQQFAPVDNAPPPAPAPHIALHPEVHAVADLPGHGQARGRRAGFARIAYIRVESELAVGIVGAVEPRHAVERQPVMRYPHQNQVLDQVCDVLPGESPPPARYDTVALAVSRW